MNQSDELRTIRAAIAKLDRKPVVAIAARAALRVAPLLVTLKGLEGDSPKLLLLLQRALLSSVVSAHSKSTSLNKVVDAADPGSAAGVFETKSMSRLMRQFQAAQSVIAAVDAADVTFVGAPTWRKFATSAVLSADLALRQAWSNLDTPDFLYSYSSATSGMSPEKVYRATVLSDIRNLQDGMSVSDVFRLPLWGTYLRSTGEFIDEFLRWSAEINGFGFWPRWNAAMDAGEPIDWAIQEEIALIPNDIWKAGPEAVGAAIAEIEARYAPKSEIRAEAVDGEIAKNKDGYARMSKAVVERGVASEVAAIAGADEIEAAINRFCNETGLNQVPEELRALQSVAGGLRRIGGVVAGALQDAAEKDGKIAALERELAALKLSYEALAKEFAEASKPGEKSEFWVSYWKTLGQAAAGGTLSTLVLTAGYFVAPEYCPEVVRHLGDRAMAMFESSGVSLPQVNTLPQISS